MKQKNIVFLTQYFPPEMGAPQSRIFELCTALSVRGWNVLVITAHPNYPQGKIFGAYKGKWFSNETMNQFSVLRFPIYPSNSRKALPRIVNMLSFSISSLFSLVKIKHFKAGFIITETPPLTLTITGKILAYFSGAKHILNVSDIWPLSAYELGAISNGRLYRWLERLERYSYRTAFACMGQSQEITDHCGNNGAKRKLLFRNGVDVSRFLPKSVDSMGSRKIVYMGLLGVAQGILALCQNLDFKALGYEFHIYGQGAERKELEVYIVNEGAEKNIVLHESIQRNDVPKVLTSYDLTIIPLIKPIKGAVPSKIYEAMAAGLPIVFAGGGEGAKLISELNAGWICEPSDFESISTKLTEIAVLSISEWEDYRKRARAAAEQLFDRTLQIEKLDSFLTEHLSV